MTSAIEVLDGGRLIAFSFEDLMKYHGPGSPGGVAHALLALREGFVTEELKRERAERSLARPASEVYGHEDSAQG
jgi:hypothetical protein